MGETIAVRKERWAGFQAIKGVNMKKKQMPLYQAIGWLIIGAGLIIFIVGKVLEMF